MNNLAPVFCIMGPTASGKTDLAIALSRDLPIEIINVDSAQIYQGMDIGSGKPSKEIQQLIPHHLMDFLDPAIPYSAAQFRQDAIRVIQDIHARKALPLLVGGTMLYFKILQEGIAQLPDRDNDIRALIEAKAKEQGWVALHEELARKDPQSAIRIKPTDPQRIQRALEIIEITGKSMSSMLNQPKVAAPFNFINIGLMPLTTERAVLHQQIEKRFDAMLAQGLIEEVQSLKARQDLNLMMPSMRAVGYRQVWQYLDNEFNFDMMREKAIVATRQLAKRQLTWLRQWLNLTTYDFLDTESLGKLKALISRYAFGSHSVTHA